jgi:TetR/AcrR family transcriptional regulator, regulator of cefoperazone and chloramphenicol sensitivity
LRTIADEAGTSVGLVQHYYGTKAALIAAVNEYVVQVISEAVRRAPLPSPTGEAMIEMGERLTNVMAQEPDVFDYLGRALVEGTSAGSEIFDGLVRISAAQADMFYEREQVRPDLDPLWGVLNPLLLRLGAMILRGHVERHLAEPFNTPTQLRRWDEAVTGLLRHGQLKSE